MTLQLVCSDFATFATSFATFGYYTSWPRVETSDSGLEMITRDELKSLEEETKSRWKACLALVIMLRYRELAREPRGVVRSSGPDNDRAPLVVVLGDGCENASLCAALESQGVKARTADLLEEASALTEMEGVRLVVVDETFFDSASVGWQLRHHRTIPIVLLGSSRDKEGWEKACELEADAYLSKSMTQAERVARIKAILRRYEAF
jgi:CheY-like chemotaxis protein